MSITKLLLIFMCCVIAIPSVWGQNANSGQTANSQANSGVLGYLDPHTGAFRPVAAASEDSLIDAASLLTFGGTITVTITVTLKTTSLTTVTCSGAVSVVDNAATGAPRIFSETDTVAATGTGTSRSCKISIPYAWGLATQAGDSMSTSYSVFGTAGTTGLPQRTSSLSPLDTRKVPANGTITALTAAVTL